MTSTPRILAFSGSLREGSHNMNLARNAAAGARAAGAEVTELDIRDVPLPLYSADLESAQGLPDNALEIKEILKSHHGFIIGSPENNSMFSAALKNLVDWASRPAQDEPPLACFRGKVAAIMSASPGGLGGLRGLFALRLMLESIGVLVIPDQKAIPEAHNAYDAQGRLTDDKQREAIEKIGARLVDVTRRLMD